MRGRAQSNYASDALGNTSHARWPPGTTCNLFTFCILQENRKTGPSVGELPPAGGLLTSGPAQGRLRSRAAGPAPHAPARSSARAGARVPRSRALARSPVRIGSETSHPGEPFKPWNMPWKVGNCQNENRRTLIDCVLEFEERCSLITVAVVDGAGLPIF